MQLKWYRRFKTKLFLVVVIIPIFIISVALVFGLDIVQTQLKIQHLENINLTTKFKASQIADFIAHKKEELQIGLMAELPFLDKDQDSNFISMRKGHLYSSIVDLKSDKKIKVIKNIYFDNENVDQLLKFNGPNSQSLILGAGQIYLASSIAPLDSKYMINDLSYIEQKELFSNSPEAPLLLTKGNEIIAGHFDKFPSPILSKVRDNFLDQVRQNNNGVIPLEVSKEKNQYLSYSKIPNTEDNYLIRFVSGANVLGIFNSMRDRAFLTILIVLSSLILLSGYISSNFSKAVEQITNGLDKISNGSIGHEFRVRGSDEFSALAQKISEMSLKIHKQFNTILQKDQEIKDVEQLATTDKMTGLNNYLAFQNFTNYLSANSEKHGQYFGLFLIDVDKFKVFNDTYGHLQGDLVLKEVAQCMKMTAQKGQFIGRYGGEEFISVFPADSENTVMEYMEKLRLAIASKTVKHLEKPGESLSVTASFGGVYFQLCPTDEPEDYWKKIVKAADSNLYESKENGRNQSKVSFI
ncbi:MAG: diguanylate cyclase [Bdellovibrionota bacterium]|nr:diguanylate cyclase [Bdellovibrionota bacterium]